MRAFGFGCLMLLVLVLLETWPVPNDFWRVSFADVPSTEELDALAQRSGTSVIEVKDGGVVVLWAGRKSSVSQLYAGGATLVMKARPSLGCGGQSTTVEIP